MAHTSRDLPGAFGRLPRPVREFLDTEASGGIVLLIGTIIALVWANAPFGETYEKFWHTDVSLGWGDASLNLDLRHWINEGLMAIFFFVAGLEIKRELVKGELQDRRRATLPVISALGGMLVPALLYLGFTIGGEGARGWGIPMATDIAFAIGILSLFGSRVSQSLKIYLLSLAIVDDIGAILVIALFYTESLDLGSLLIAALLLAITPVLWRRQVLSPPLFLVLGILVWFFAHESGVHATIAGVLLGLITPVLPSDPAARATVEEEDDLPTSVADRLIHQIHPYSSYIVVPLFALANAGIPLHASVLSEAAGSRIFLGIFAGLVAGKLVGITLFSWAGVRLGIASVPEDATWPQLAGVAALGGVGFTVSLFIAGLAFTGEAAEAARIGILAASLTASLVGSLILFRARSPGTAGDSGAT